MKAIILDYTEGKVKIINNLEDEVQVDDVENILTDKYNIDISNVEYMICSDLEIETLD